MTYITTASQARAVPARWTQLGLALVLGLGIGSGSAFLALRGEDTGVAAIAPMVGPTTDASTQYSAWYLRRSEGAVPPAGVGNHVDEGGTDPSSLAGSTTAGEQYRAWYTRDRDGR